MTAPKQPKDPGITLRNGKYQAKVYYYDKDGKRRAKSKAGFERLSEARAFVKEYQYLALKNELAKGSDITLPDYFEEWFQLYKENVVAHRTKEIYQYSLKIIKQYFSDIRLADIDRKIYQQFLQKFGHNHAKETVTKVNTHIHVCVRSAIYDGIIKRDFVEHTTLVYDEKRTQVIDYLSIEELVKLVEYVENSLNYHYTSKYMILLAAYTGMRLGEVQGLQWRDINFNFKTISIQRSWSAIENSYKPTKNKSSKRVIRINAGLIKILKQLKAAISPAPTQQVFINQFNTVPTSNAVNKVLRAALVKAGINKPSFHFHSLRHTHVAYLLANQVDLYAISKRLGHSDIGTTSRVYSYMIDEYRIRTDNHIETVLDGIENTLRTDSAEPHYNRG